MPILYLMMGAPGAGKSTWLKGREIDAVRFSLVAEDEEYFSKEKEVFSTYISTINNYLSQGFNVIADATHLNAASRNKTIRNIKVKDADIRVIWIKTPLNQCLAQNEFRIGTRGYVPQSAIINMYGSIQTPSFEEGINTIYISEPNKPLQILHKEE